ncbi:MAG: cellulase [Ignavibacteriae bacterium]|nr:MAG: cellulase [Ignavibacteriota bacterium]
MKKILFFVLLITLQIKAQDNWIRINQLGYKSHSIKVAVFLSFNPDISLKEFNLIDSGTNKVVFTSYKIKSFRNYGNFKNTFRLDFSEFVKEGSFYVKVGETKSPIFRIDEDVYKGTADYLLNYMRQQRCGYNPFLKDSCHTHDGFIVDHPTLDSTYIDVAGGWHDASDYLQYLPTSANAVYQMLFAYKMNPAFFTDKYKANGDKGANGIPDILDEAKWGLDWLVKMNPDSAIMFNQIADDRDHAGFRLPNKDSVNYGKGLERPVYFITGKKQGLAKYKNRTTGVSSSAGKFASAFALGSELLKDFYPNFADKILRKAKQAFYFGMIDFGNTQTASNKAPYFYEEDNYVDDLELAAAQLYEVTKDKKYLTQGNYWGALEYFTPWMGADTARHYQWYPFVNFGHYLLASFEDNNKKSHFIRFMKMGLDQLYQRGNDNVFLNGIPFIWCSNNLVAAALTQARLYENLTGDKKYLEMEAALRDWLFGCNPWGTSMIVGLPEHGDYPNNVHSAFVLKENGFQTYGGLVDGPVYGSIYKNLMWIKLFEPDEYEKFQSDLVVYHDDIGDYSTNEPTMDGTASLTYYLSSLEKNDKNNLTEYGAVIRGDTTKKNIYLIFSGGDFGEGCEYISEVLNKQNIKANFFFTGDFYRNAKFKKCIEQLKAEGHYLGAHSNKHLLYAAWENRDSLLVTKEEFILDLKNNYKEMKKFGLTEGDANYFLPPYEWYNAEIAKWTKELGLQLINYSPGTKSVTDYTTPDMGNRYIASDKILRSILNYEEKSSNGLNGFYLLLHVGTDQKRTDKFYYKLNYLISEIKKRGYKFKLFNLR